jgi:hypothetical protein
MLWVGRSIVMHQAGLAALLAGEIEHGRTRSLTAEAHRLAAFHA